MTEQEFQDAVIKICADDKDGLKEIYTAYSGYLYAVVYDVLGNKENAEDVTTDVFIKLWTVLKQYIAGNGHRGYLATIARNAAIDFIRKRKREVLTDDFTGVTSGMDASEPAVACMAADEDSDSGSLVRGGNVSSPVEDEVVAAANVEEALQQLKEAERQIVTMKVLGQLTFKEIAQILQLPMGTVTWKYQNAISKLRRCGYE